MQLKLLPEHGRIPCAQCFPAPEASKPWGEAFREWPERWQLRCNPLAWGSRNPRVLVLGFSKSDMQNQRILHRRHEDIPFRTHWPTLTAILKSLGLLPTRDSVRSHFGADEPDLAFGSLLRCSVARWRKGEWIKSGNDVMPAAVNDMLIRPIFEQCVRNFLTNLPSRLKLVVLQGNQDRYMKACSDIIWTAYPKLRRVNLVAYGTDQVTFVHTIHCAAQGVDDVQDWLGRGEKSSDQSVKGRLAREVVEAVRKHYWMEGNATERQKGVRSA